MVDPVAEKASALVSALMNETDQIKELVLPALNDVLKQVRDVRMAISGEATQILNSFGTLRKTAEYSEQLERFSRAIEGLVRTVEGLDTPTKERFHDFFRD